VQLTFPKDRDYETLAGFILDEIGHIPEVGEVLSYEDWTFEIVDMDGRRIDKVLATHAPAHPLGGEMSEF